ncbi:META domain-containing protein [Pseudonocardia humida]|uniref:META domain-containing protein n=1 Tax=Pseudonocardia humida TaxID=2800819 RepID=A0ABT0ZU10_9PSEU|nr:META domain-containing protein [Pseudonocardia humida]MCO1654221.1 hypothetical protein [Pseudonocardia humida]
MRLLLNAPLAVLLAVAGCAAVPPALTVVPATPSPPDPGALPGWWRVAETGETVVIGPGGAEVRAAGVPAGGPVHTGDWKADPGGRFLAQLDVYWYPGDWPTPPDAVPPAPEWAAAATGFRVDGPDRVLLGRDGSPVARLVPEPPGTTSVLDHAGGPVLDGTRGALAPAVPVPAPLRPAGPDELVGRWSPVTATGPASVEFDASGAWRGTVGCVDLGARWTAGPDGGFLAIEPPFRPEPACEHPYDVAAELSRARRVALDGPELVLLDVDGTQVGRYARPQR